MYPKRKIATDDTSDKQEDLFGDPDKDKHSIVSRLPFSAEKSFARYDREEAMRGCHLWLSYLFPFIFFSVVASVAYAQDDIPTHTVDGAYIKEWLVIGPFPRALEADFLAAAGSETNIRPREGMELTAPNGAVYTWKRHSSANPVINLLEAIGDYTDVVAYAA
jgi:hypothetical protein